jgi:DNA-binding LacI/PurR family transcriptional regulator
MRTLFPLSVTTSSGETLVEQLHRQLTWLIAAGSLRPGDTLPSIRDLAGQLAINMHTVRSAYQRLEQDGLVRTRPGSGTQVLMPDPRAMMDLAGRTRSYTIGVILPGMANPFYHEFLQGVQDGIGQERLLAFVCDAHEQESEYMRIFAQLTARNVDGLLIASFDIHPLLGDTPGSVLPLVTVDWPGCAGPTVNFDLEQASHQAVQHLIQHGHRQIGLVTFAGAGANVEQINSGYFRALSENGLAVQESLIVRVPDFHLESGENAGHRLMSLPKPPTAIFAIADMLTLGILRRLKGDGYRVPSDVALASLNDIAVSGLVEPPLTTVAMPARRLGLEAMNMLQSLIDSKQPENMRVTLPTELIVRQSCGCRR